MEQNGINHTAGFLKRRARALRKETGIPHHTALDKIVQAEGFANWPHYLKTLKSHPPTSQRANIADNVGTCALCGMTATTLRSSHYLAAAFFRRLHREDRGRVMPPISLNARRAMYNCKQAQAKLLCDICEHRFAVQGENWVIECTCQKDGRFPLRDLLLGSLPIEKVGPTPEGRLAFVYAGSRIPAIRHHEITYFAASVFWRGWAYDWSRVSEHCQLEFPPELGPAFGDFLLGEAAFPSSVVLQVEVAVNPVVGSGTLGMIFPQRIMPRKPNASSEPRGYFFMVCGMTFILYFDLGKPAGLSTKALSIAEPPHIISLTDVRMSEADAECKQMELTAKRVGGLARGRT